MFEPKSILVPTDFSSYSDEALKSAVDIASRYGSKLYILHVIDREVQECAIDYCLPADVAERLKIDAQKTSRERLEREIQSVAATRNVQIEFDIRMGIPFETILEEQKDRNVDLIVMASHGRTGLLHHLGSVADKVMRGATCPVLLVKPRPAASGGEGREKR